MFGKAYENADSEKPDVLYYSGLAAYGCRMWENAVQLLTELVTICPEFTDGAEAFRTFTGPAN